MNYKGLFFSFNKCINEYIKFQNIIMFMECLIYLFIIYQIFKLLIIKENVIYSFQVVIVINQNL